MRIQKREYHQMTSYMDYDIPEEDIIETFGSVERFSEILSLNSVNWQYREDMLQDMEEPTPEEEDAFWEFFEGYDYDREDDIWTDRKGGYDIEYEIMEDNDE